MTKFFSYSLHFAFGCVLIMAPFHKDFRSQLQNGADVLSVVLGVGAVLQASEKIAKADRND